MVPPMSEKQSSHTGNQSGPHQSDSGPAHDGPNQSGPSHSDSNRDGASFGFRTVDPSEKAGMVRGVFDKVAPVYDIMNDVMSLGVHRMWKDAMISWLNPRSGEHFLDVAGGTGDIAFRILDQIHARGGTGSVIVSDINAEMLVQGAKRAEARFNGGQPVPDGWLCADAQTLPLEDASLDGYTIAFGIRNVTFIDQALREAHRVLRRGARFLCLEFSTPSVPGLGPLYDLYSFNVIPRMGGLVARDAESYRYLVESIRRFPDQRRFAAMMEDAGFTSVRHRDLAGGIAALHMGWKA